MILSPPGGSESRHQGTGRGQCPQVPPSRECSGPPQPPDESMLGFCWLLYTFSTHLSFGSKRVEVKVLPPQEDLADSLKVTSDLLLWAEPLPSWVDQVGVPTPSCCSRHPLRHFPTKYFKTCFECPNPCHSQKITNLPNLDHRHTWKIPAPSWRKGRVVEKGRSVFSVVPFIGSLRPEKERSREFSCS